MTIPADEGAKSDTETALDSVSQDLIESISTDAILKLDEEGNINSWLDSTHSLYGYEATTIAHEHFSELLVELRSGLGFRSESELDSGGREL